MWQYGRLHLTGLIELCCINLCDLWLNIVDYSLLFTTYHKIKDSRLDWNINTGPELNNFVMSVWWLWLRGGAGVVLSEGCWFDSPGLHVKVSLVKIMNPKLLPLASKNVTRWCLNSSRVQLWEETGHWRGCRGEKNILSISTLVLYQDKWWKLQNWTSSCVEGLGKEDTCFILKIGGGSLVFIHPYLTVEGFDWLWATSDRWRRRPQAAELHRGRTWSGRTGLGCRTLLCALGARTLLQLLDPQHDRLQHPKHGLADFPILSSPRTHAGRLNVDAGRTRRWGCSRRSTHGLRFFPWDHRRLVIFITLPRPWRTKQQPSRTTMKMYRRAAISASINQCTGGSSCWGRPRSMVPLASSITRTRRNSAVNHLCPRKSWTWRLASTSTSGQIPRTSTWSSFIPAARALPSLRTARRSRTSGTRRCWTSSATVRYEKCDMIPTVCFCIRPVLP